MILVMRIERAWRGRRLLITTLVLHLIVIARLSVGTVVYYAEGPGVNAGWVYVRTFLHRGGPARQRELHSSTGNFN